MCRDVKRYGLRVGFSSFLAQPTAGAGIEDKGVLKLGVKADTLLRAQQ